MNALVAFQSFPSFLVESFSIHTHEVLGSFGFNPDGASNSLPLWENNSYFNSYFSFGKLLVLERNYSGLGFQNPELEKNCVLFPIKISNWSGFFPIKLIHSTFTDIL